MPDTYNHNGLECPHCGYLDRDTADIFAEIEQQIDDYECGNCGRKFVATKTISVTYEGKALKQGS